MISRVERRIWVRWKWAARSRITDLGNSHKRHKMHKRELGGCQMRWIISLVLALSLASPVFAQTKKGTVEHIKVHGKSLEGNLEGDSPDRDVFVYLPPSYGTNSNQRYPVVYLRSEE